MTQYYQILGLPVNADQESIKVAYRRLAKVYHPDVNQSADATENFKRIHEAYESLTKLKGKIADFGIAYSEGVYTGAGTDISRSGKAQKAHAKAKKYADLRRKSVKRNLDEVLAWKHLWAIKLMYACVVIAMLGLISGYVAGVVIAFLHFTAPSLIILLLGTLMVSNLLRYAYNFLAQYKFIFLEKR